MLAYIRSKETAFRENRAAPHLLHQMAQGYFGQLLESNGKSGIEAIEKMFSGDQKLVEAVILGLHGTIDRTDLPDAEEVIRLSQEDEMHYLCLPLLAGMLEIGRTAPASLHQLDERQLRIAVASYYCTDSTSNTPEWYLQLVSERPDIFANVQVQFTASELRSGKEYVHGLWPLAQDEALSEVARLASLPLLRKFPDTLQQKAARVAQLPLYHRVQACRQGIASAIDRPEKLLEKHGRGAACLLARGWTNRIAGHVL